MTEVTKEVLDARLAEIRERLRSLDQDVPVQEFVERIFTEHARQSEREAGEREKAARALRIELDRSISQGDEALRDHIEAQVREWHQRHTAANELELARIAIVVARLDTQFEASQEAIRKSEAAVDKEFTAANEWRAQSSERERTRLTEQATFTAEFIRSDVADVRFAKLETQIAANSSRLDRTTGSDEGAALKADGLSRTTALAIAGVTALLSFLAIIVTVVLAANGAIGGGP